ncbi:MAG: NADPH-dependent 7-cyano-7-deazaguanine reductase QueF [Proteobacteria bacterium]|nr:NADPH-dependent 7-cyano-7-deazaguanine reductase QueF [Pseudomonadota bacterium]MCL2308165.1 NADPH-dependent 7-cyano-7-deazaguanine reductase QueF [Pseudomonadota bacterium]
MNTPDHSPLGKSSAYTEHYDASLLFPIPRAPGRAELGISSGAPLPFYGVDVWNAFELSWLEPGGKPCVALARLTVPAASPNIVESKSLKLYLNSFNQTAFSSADEVRDCLSRDLSVTAGATVEVELVLPQQFSAQRIASLAGFCLDALPVNTDTYTPRPEFLLARTDAPTITETLTSHLLKSNCPVTGQPDWGSLQIAYTGHPIHHEGLLKYIVSLRRHNGFHESCVERIFIELMQRCSPLRLSVYARYTRRGGIDINPFRASHADMPLPENERLARQ